MEISPGVEETKRVEVTTQQTATRADLEDLGNESPILSDLGIKHVNLKENASEAAVDNSNEVLFDQIPLPYDPGINFKEELSNDEEVVDLSSSSKAEDSTHGSESRDVLRESLDFQPDAPSVVVCVRCHNTFPIIVLFIATRWFKHGQITEQGTVNRLAPKPFDITDDLRPEVKAREESVDAIEQEGDEGKEVAELALKVREEITIMITNH